MNGNWTTSPGRGGRLALLTGVFVAMIAVAAYAQAPGAGGEGAAGPGAATDASASGGAAVSNPAADAGEGQMPTLRQMFEFSPKINSAILGLSAISMLLFVYLLLTIHARAMVPHDFVDEVNKLVIRGKYEAAADLCRANRRIFIATIIQRCMENAHKPTTVIQNIIDSEGRRRADLVWNRISYLADIANVAPMLGLLGTVIGMITSFFTLDKASGSITSKALSSGVGQAMTTTMFGLGVAIMTLLFYAIIKSRVTQTLAEAEQAVHAVADHIRREGGTQIVRKRVSAKLPGGADGRDVGPGRSTRPASPLESRVGDRTGGEGGDL